MSALWMITLTLLGGRDDVPGLEIGIWSDQMYCHIAIASRGLLIQIEEQPGSRRGPLFRGLEMASGVFSQDRVWKIPWCALAVGVERRIELAGVHLGTGYLWPHANRAWWLIAPAWRFRIESVELAP